MENKKNTTQYVNIIKNIFVLVLFSLIIPLATVSAQYDNYDVTTGSYGNYDTNTNPYGNYNSTTGSYGNYDVTTGAYGSYDTNTNPYGNYNTPNTVTSGGFSTSNDVTTQPYGNYDITTQPYGSYDVTTQPYGSYNTNPVSTAQNTSDYPNNYAVTSGGYYGGNYSGYSNYSYYPYSSLVTTGGFTAGPVTPSTQQTYTPYDGTVSTGGFTGGYQTYYPVTYSSQPVIQNQVLAYTDTNPSLSSVYLSDVPYTGLADSLPIIIFISSVLLWSGVLAYKLVQRKIESQLVLAGAHINVSKVKNTESSHITNFMKQIKSDSSDISKVEDYARINKILLSSDAAAKIVKLVRLGKINASEYIRSVATGEWIAIGEKDIKI